MSVAHTVYMMHAIIKQTPMDIDMETLNELSIAVFSNDYYKDRMSRLWERGRIVIEEIYHLLMNPRDDDPVINMTFISSYEKTTFILLRDEDELDEVERWERDEPENRTLETDPAIEAWLNEDNERVDDPLPFDSPNMGRPLPVEDENLTDEQRTIQWATSLGGGADNL